MNFKKLGILAALALLLVGGGYAAGRYAAPEKVVVTEKIKEVEVTKVVTVSDTEQILNALKTVQQDVNKQKDVHIVKTIVRDKEGNVTTTVTTDDKSKTDTKTDSKTESQAKTATQNKTDSETTKVVEKEVVKVVERERPSWALTLQPGFDVAGALGYGNPYSILPSDNYLLRHAVIGVSVEHRLIGPLSTGLWANSSGAGGVTIRLEF